MSKIKALLIYPALLVLDSGIYIFHGSLSWKELREVSLNNFETLWNG